MVQKTRRRAYLTAIDWPIRQENTARPQQTRSRNPARFAKKSFAFDKNSQCQNGAARHLQVHSAYESGLILNSWGHILAQLYSHVSISFLKCLLLSTTFIIFIYCHYHVVGWHHRHVLWKEAQHEWMKKLTTAISGCWIHVCICYSGPGLHTARISSQLPGYLRNSNPT